MPERNDGSHRGAELEPMPERELGAQLGAAAQPGRSMLRRARHPQPFADRTPHVELEAGAKAQGTCRGEAPGTADGMCRPMLEADAATTREPVLFRKARIGAQQDPRLPTRRGPGKAQADTEREGLRGREPTLQQRKANGAQLHALRSAVLGGRAQLIDLDSKRRPRARSRDRRVRARQRSTLDAPNTRAERRMTPRARPLRRTPRVRAPHPTA